MKILMMIHSQFQSKGRNTSASFRAYPNPPALAGGGLMAIKNDLAKLMAEIESVWDGTESHAQLLSRLIRSTKSFRIEERTT